MRDIKSDWQCRPSQGVRGYREEGTTTTPFDMCVLNHLDRFHLVADVIDRVPKLGSRAAYAKQATSSSTTRHSSPGTEKTCPRLRAGDGDRRRLLWRFVRQRPTTSDPDCREANVNLFAIRPGETTWSYVEP